LSGELPRRISKLELQQQIEEIHNEITGPNLPDEFGDLKPPEDCETPDIMRKQIELVNGGPGESSGRGARAGKAGTNGSAGWTVRSRSGRNSTVRPEVNRRVERSTRADVRRYG